jgi:5'-3' exonuclease
MTEHILLIDCSGLIYRAYHAFPKSTRKDGLETQAIIGFMSIAWNLIGRAAADPFTHVAAVFDSRGRTFRHKIFSGYKAHRVRHEGLDEQLPLAREAARVLGLEPVELEGWESDDIIATLAARAKAAGIRATIVSQDKDFAQCVEDGVVEIADPVKHIRLMSKQVEKIWGVPPDRVTHLQALMGDSADNIPGVPGVGPKTALELVKRFPNFNAMMAALEGPAPRGITQRIWLALRKARPHLPMYHQLVTLRSDVPIEVDFDRLKPETVTKDHLLDMLRVLEAENRFDGLFGQDPRLFRRAEPVKDPYAWWRAELKRSGQKIPEEPQAGWYKRRLVQRGAYVAARIWREPEIDFETGRPTGKDTLACEVAKERRDPVNEWGYLCRMPIAEADYKHMIELAEWARLHAKHEPEADPFSAIDWDKVAL